MTTIALRPGGASGEVTDRSGPPPGATVDADKYKYKYFIAIAVTLAAVLELIDTSIVNVAIPHMMGNLGATIDEISSLGFKGIQLRSSVLERFAEKPAALRDLLAQRTKPNIPGAIACTARSAVR